MATPEAAGQQGITTRDALVAIIPTEVLAFYTPIATLIGTQLLKDATRPDRYMGVRWGIFVTGIVFSIALVLVDRLKGETTKWPAAEAFSAGVAFAAWALVIPESPLLAETKNDLDGLLVVLIGGGAVLLLGTVSALFTTRQRK